MISLIVGAVATSEILEPGSHLTVVGIDDCRSISVHLQQTDQVPHRAISLQASVFRVTFLALLSE